MIIDGQSDGHWWIPLAQFGSIHFGWSWWLWYFDEWSCQIERHEMPMFSSRRRFPWCESAMRLEDVTCYTAHFIGGDNWNDFPRWRRVGRPIPSAWFHQLIPPADSSFWLHISRNCPLLIFSHGGVCGILIFVVAVFFLLSFVWLFSKNRGGICRNSLQTRMVTLLDPSSDSFWILWGFFLKRRRGRRWRWRWRWRWRGWIDLWNDWELNALLVFEFRLEENWRLVTRLEVSSRIFEPRAPFCDVTARSPLPAPFPFPIFKYSNDAN